MSFFRYPGGKKKLRTQILAALHDQQHGHSYIYSEYREPFFGGGSIGLEILYDNPDFPDIESAWINDKDAGIAALWQAVFQYPTELKAKIAAFTPSVQAFDDFKSILTNPDLQFPSDPSEVVELGFKKLAIHQISYSGLGTKSGGPLGGRDQDESTTYPIDCRWSPVYIQQKIDSVNAKVRINSQDIKVTCADFEEVIAYTDDRILMYLDPPYYVKGNDLYECGFSQEDHIRLATLLKDSKHAWVLSYDDCKEIRDLYEGWSNIQSVDVNYSITAKHNKEDKGGKRVPTKKPELIISKKL